MISEKLAEELRKMGETMVVTEIASEIKRGFRGIAFVLFICTFTLISTACFIAYCFNEKETAFIIVAVLMSVVSGFLLYFYLNVFCSWDKKQKDEISNLEIEIEETQPKNGLWKVESNQAEDDKKGE